LTPSLKLCSVAKNIVALSTPEPDSPHHGRQNVEGRQRQRQQHGLCFNSMSPERIQSLIADEDQEGISHAAVFFSALTFSY
jgi:hypothetical protein